MSDDELHVLAADYASKLVQEMCEYRSKYNDPVDRQEMQITWILRYEGYIAGYKACLAETTIH